MPRKLPHLCEVCTEVIFNKNKWSRYCNICADEIRERSLSTLWEKKKEVPKKSELEKTAYEKYMYKGKPRLKKGIRTFIIEKDKMGHTDKDIINFVRIRFSVNIHREDIDNCRKKWLKTSSRKKKRKI